MDRSSWSRCHFNRRIASEGVVWWAVRGLEGHVWSVPQFRPHHSLPCPLPNGHDLIVVVVVSPYMSVCKRRTVIIRDHSHTAISHSSPSPVRFNFKLVYRWLGEREIFPSVSFNLLNYWKQLSKWEMRKNHVLMYYDYNKKLSINVQLNLFILLFANIFDFYYIKQRSSSLYK